MSDLSTTSSKRKAQSNSNSPTFIYNSHNGMYVKWRGGKRAWVELLLATILTRTSEVGEN